MSQGNAELSKTMPPVYVPVCVSSIPSADEICISLVFETACWIYSPEAWGRRPGDFLGAVVELGKGARS